MKEYRILQTFPKCAIVNVHDERGIIAGYTEIVTANVDLERVRASFPDRKFEIVGYTPLRVDVQWREFMENARADNLIWCARFGHDWIDRPLLSVHNHCRRCGMKKDES